MSVTSLAVLNSTSGIDFDSLPKNEFMPKKDPDLYLTKNEAGFLKIYSIFAINMNDLYRTKDQWVPNSKEWLAKEKVVIDIADSAVAYLKKNPFCNKQVTSALIKFLEVTGDSLTLGIWMGEDYLSMQKK